MRICQILQKSGSNKAGPIKKTVGVIVELLYILFYVCSAIIYQTPWEYSENFCLHYLFDAVIRLFNKNFAPAFKVSDASYHV
jgi:hypothetical protein